MQLSEIRTAIQAHGYETDTATIQTAMVNVAYRKLCGEHHWDWLKATGTLTATIGDADYSYAAITDLLHIDSVRISFGSEYYDLEYMPSEQLANRLHLNRENGIPDFWTPDYGQLLLYPRPDKAYTITIHYIKDPVDLTADADTPIFPATYHDILVYGALAGLAARERDWAQRDRWVAEYERLLEKMKRQLGIKQRQNSTYIVRSGLYDDNTQAQRRY